MVPLQAVTMTQRGLVHRTMILTAPDEIAWGLLEFIQRTDALTRAVLFAFCSRGQRLPFTVSHF